MYMHTTGKTLEESLIFTIMKKSNVRHGRQRHLFKHMEMGVNKNIDANTHMDGRSKNTILITIKCTRAAKSKSAKNLTAHIFTLKQIEERLLTNFIGSSHILEVTLYPKDKLIRELFMDNSLMFLNDVPSLLWIL